MAIYKLLEWDTTFFGFPVALIIPTNLDSERLQKCILEMHGNQVRLAYWASDPNDAPSQSAAQAHGGFLADRKVTYAMSAESIARQSNEPHVVDVIVEEYGERVSTPELDRLALQAGVYSRFKIDCRIPGGKFEELYRIWMQRSVGREIADMVYVVRHGGAIVGMLTVGEKNGRADIGLIAVDASMRGKNIGKALVLAAQKWGVDTGFSVAQVVTQGDNVAACRFYEQCGYHIDQIENIYHFWIEQ